MDKNLKKINDLINKLSNEQEWLSSLATMAKQQRLGGYSVTTKRLKRGVDSFDDLPDKDKYDINVYNIGPAKDSNEFLARCYRNSFVISYPDTFLRVYWDPFRKKRSKFMLLADDDFHLSDDRRLINDEVVMIL